jgi:hypothetical protein
MMDLGSARFGFNYTNDKEARTGTWKVAVIGTSPRLDCLIEATLIQLRSF